MGLKDWQISAEKPSKSDRLLADGNGLYLRIRPTGSKTWQFRRKRAGKVTTVALGDYPRVTLKAARLEAARHAVRHDDPSIVTVGELAEDYLDLVRKTHRRPEQVEAYLNRAVLPALKERKVASLTRAELARLVRAYSSRGNRAADSLRSQLRKMLQFAVELGYREDNPADSMTQRVAGYVPVDRDRVLSDDEIRALWAEPHGNAHLLRFLLLTGLRIGEAQKGFADGERWQVPAEASKNGRAHWVHLTPTALAELEAPFKTTATGVQSWTRRWCQRHAIEPPFRPHDCRRTAATRMADAGVEPFIIEKALNHTLQGVMRVYNRAEYEAERIAAAEALERELLRVVQTG
jgi:integrase